MADAVDCVLNATICLRSVAGMQGLVGAVGIVHNNGMLDAV